MDEDQVVLTPEQEEAQRKHNEYITKMGDIFSECWDDEAFKAAFIADPVKVFKQYGIETEEGVEYVVIEAPVRTQYCVLPHEKTREAMAVVTNFFTESVAEKDTFMPEGWEMRIIQNTEDKRFIVLPFSPDELTPEELALVAGGGWFRGKTFIFTHTVLIAVSHGVVATEVAAVALVAVAVAVAAVAVAVTV